jgi:hypothetical protein
VSADVEIQGLDMPEFGAEAYPEFVLHSTRGAPLSAGVAAPPGEGSISGSKDGKNAGDEPIVFEGSRP